MPDKPESKTYYCEQCPKTFTRSNSYKVHLMKHDGKRYSCNICDKSYTASHSLKIHKQIHFHPHDRPYKCQYCEASFVQSGHRNRHENLTHGTKQSVCRMKSKDKSKRPMIVCRVCKRMFCSMSSYKVHEKKHKGERHYCTRCAKSFTTHTQLTRHEQEHDEITKYKCDQCDKTFNRKSNLARHKHLHTGKHRYVCHVCGKAFILFEGYSAHLNVHQDQPSTWCNVCGQSFKFLSSLKAHKKMHSNEKDYKCDICYRVFLRKRTLEDHLKVHAKGTTRKALITTPVAFCQMCSKGFSSSYGLQRHMRKHRLGQLKTYNRIQNQVFTPPPENSNTKTSKEKTVVEHAEVPSDNAPGFHKIYPEQFSAAADDDGDDNEGADDNVCITVEHSQGCSDTGDTITVIIHETNDLTENTGSAGFDLDKSINHDNSDVNMMDDIPEKDLDNNGTVSTDNMMESVTAQTVDIHDGVLSENMSVRSSNNSVEPVTALNQPYETSKSIERGHYINQCNQILTSSESGQNMNQTNNIYTSQSDTQGINQGNEIFNLGCDGHSNGNKLDILGVAYQLCQDMNVTDSVVDDFLVLPTTGTVTVNEIQEPLNDLNNVPETGIFSNTDAGSTPETYFAVNSDTQAGIVVENVNIESTHTATVCASQTNQIPPQITNSKIVDEIKSIPSSITPPAIVNRNDQRSNQPLDCHIGDESTNTDVDTFSNLDSKANDDTTSTTNCPESQNETCQDTPHMKPGVKQDEVQFECQYCMSQYATYKSLRAHLYRYHSDGENNMYTCDKCGKMFASKVIYLNHVDNHKWRGVKFDKDIECETCGDIFKSHLSYYRHMRIKHHVYEDIGEDKRKDRHVVTQVDDRSLATGNVDETQSATGGVNMARSKNSVNIQNENPLPRSNATHSVSENTDEEHDGIGTNKNTELNHCSNMGEQILKHNMSTNSATGADGLCNVENNSSQKQVLVDNSVVNTLQSERIDKISNALGGNGIESGLRSNKNSLRKQSLTLKLQAEVSANESHGSNKTQTPTRSVLKKPTLYKCEECDQSFSSKWNKQNHMSSVHSDKFLCENCPKRFSNLTNLKRHIEIHHTYEDGTLSKNHMCPECGKCFTASDSLRIHMYSHTGERPYQCDQCEASYTQSGHLQRHVNTAHIKQPVYQCQHTGCAKTFYNQSSLKMHEKIHSEIRAYQCTVCSKTFKTPYVLNHHTKTHVDTKDHECPICHQFLSTRHSLQRHLERHQAVEKMNPASSSYDPNYHVNVRQRSIKKMGDKTFECESCMSKFTTKRALQAHKKKFCRGHEIK